MSLDALHGGDARRLTRVSDGDPEMLRYLSELGIPESSLIGRHSVP